MEENLSYHKKESSELNEKQPSPLILKNEMEINANNDKDKDIFVPAPPPEYKEIYAQHIHKHYSPSSQLLNIKVGEVQNLFNSAGISALFIEIDLADKIGKVVPELISDSCTTFDQLPSTEYDGMKVIYDFAPQDKVTTDIGQVISNIKEGGLLVEFERQYSKSNNTFPPFKLLLIGPKRLYSKIFDTTTNYELFCGKGKRNICGVLDVEVSGTSSKTIQRIFYAFHSFSALKKLKNSFKTELSMDEFLELLPAKISSEIDGRTYYKSKITKGSAEPEIGPTIKEIIGGIQEKGFKSYFEDVDLWKGKNIFFILPLNAPNSDYLKLELDIKNK